jgi:cytochrome b
MTEPQKDRTVRTLRVWDLPTRLFHWVLVLCVISLVITGQVGGQAMVWHFRLGYVVGSLLVFRLAWGLIGGYYSRFASFIYAPQSILNYLKGKASPAHLVGHNPMGAFSVFAMIGLLVAQVGSGLVSDDEIAFAGPLTRFVSGQWVSLATHYHKEIGKTIIILLVLLHVAAILFYRFKKNENLVKPMLVGDKDVAHDAPQSTDSIATRMVALVIWLAAMGLFWWISTFAV